ncbi:hypothetical protein JIN85_10595 [Luteolibacter pohnpeiensis]|uniref:Uncharacterized protein n=1 Tax=Luteolibacter pohnpeiensis TaxID=454153 RepID=A0A934S5C3_9BACT|nr:hypothetical protein [Luteolibacter pohnpeiensis]MBK1882866.1 hypothetical protein [Luteolibacter pohnpeiensis]
MILAHGRSQIKKGDLLRYHHDTGTLELPRTGVTIENGRYRVWFSSEHFSNGEHYYEFNIVIDGERTKFLSSTSSNGFKSIAKPLEELGFPVRHQKIKL